MTAYDVAAHRVIAAAVASPEVSAIAVVPVTLNLVIGTNAGDEENDEVNVPLCHKTQVVLSLDSQRQTADFITVTLMQELMTRVEGLKDHIL